MLNSWAAASDKIIKDFDGLNTNVDNFNGYFEDLRDDFNLNTDKIDIIYENLSFINEWVKKLDAFAKNVEVIKAGYDAEADLPGKIEEITEQIALVKEWNKKADALALQVRALSVQISETESTVNSKNLADMRELFAQMTEDMSNLSLRTNKMILESDKSNDSMKEHITSLENLILNFDRKTNDLAFDDLRNKIDVIKAISEKSSGVEKGITESFLYLAEWIDSAGNAINSIRSEIETLKEQQSANAKTTGALSENQQAINNNLQILMTEILNQNKSASDNSFAEEIASQLKRLNENSGEDLKNSLSAQNEKFSVLQEQIKFLLQNNTSGDNPIFQKLYEQAEKNAALQAINQQMLQEISKNLGNSDIMQALETITQLVQNSNQNDNFAIKEVSYNDDILKEKTNNSEIKKLLDFIAAQVVNMNENSSKTDMLAKKLDMVESKISNLEQYMAKLIDYLDED